MDMKIKVKGKQIKAQFIEESEPREFDGPEEWLTICLMDHSDFPLVKVMEDTGSRWLQALVERNGKIATLRIDGEEANYGIDMSEHPVFVKESLGFFWLGIAKAIKIPDGTLVYSADNR